MTWPVNWCKIWGIEFYRTIGFLCNFTEKEKIIYLKRVGTEHTCNPPIMRSKKKGRIAKRSTRFIGPIKNWNLRGEHANLICKIQRIRNLFILLIRWWIIELVSILIFTLFYCLPYILWERKPQQYYQLCPWQMWPLGNAQLVCRLLVGLQFPRIEIRETFPKQKSSSKSRQLLMR